MKVRDLFEGLYKLHSNPESLNNESKIEYYTNVIQRYCVNHDRAEIESAYAFFMEFPQYHYTGKMYRIEPKKTVSLSNRVHSFSKTTRYYKTYITHFNNETGSNDKLKEFRLLEQTGTGLDVFLLLKSLVKNWSPEFPEQEEILSIANATIHEISFTTKEIDHVVKNKHMWQGTIV